MSATTSGPESEREAPADRPSRRDVLALGAWTGVAAFLGRSALGGADEAEPLPRRKLGRTGWESTVFGLGCFPLGGIPEEDKALRVLLRALDAGCNYLDTAPSYAAGRSESRVGQALRERPEAKVFVATKTHTRTAADARRDVEGSLQRLGRHPIDLVQVHAVTDADDLEKVLAPDGPLAGLVKAREEGLLRFIGVTGHADPSVVRQTFERWPFDTVLFPLNCVDPHHLSFQKGTLPAAVEKGIGRIAMKVFASGNLPKHHVDAEACLRYTFALDVSTAIVGCRSVEEVDLAARVAREARPLSAEERDQLLDATRPHQGRGVEWYKKA